MAKVLNKDPLDYQRETESFLCELRRFHVNRGSPFHRLPRLSGKSIDLYLLYVLVTTRGGWEKVNDFNEWESLVPLFGVPSCCVNAGLALKQLYLRYLDHYEKVHFHGEEYDVRHDDGSIVHDTASRMSRRHHIRAFNAVPMSYNQSQHVVSDSLRQSLGMSRLLEAGQYDALYMSLLSPLPNEHDFALNVCALLSGECGAEDSRLKLSSCDRLLDALLVHAGVCSNDATRDYMMDMYKSCRGNNAFHFWCDSVKDPNVLSLLPSDNESDSLDQDSSCAVSLFAESLHTDRSSRLPSPGMLDDCDGSLSLHVQLGRLERIGFRVLQVLYVLRNLSFDDDNVSILANSCSCVRLLLLAVHCQWSSIASHARDTLSNVCSDISARHLSPRLFGWLLNWTSSVLADSALEDRSQVICAMNVLSQLARGSEDNDGPLMRLLTAQRRQLLSSVCALLTLQDILLLLTTLECMLALTALGEPVCCICSRYPGFVSILVSLLSVEAQSYGPGACIMMKVIQNSSRVVSSVASAASVPARVSPAPSTSTATLTQSAQLSSSHLPAVSSHSSLVESVTHNPTSSVSVLIQTRTPTPPVSPALPEPTSLKSASSVTTAITTRPTASIMPTISNKLSCHATPARSPTPVSVSAPSAIAQHALIAKPSASAVNKQLLKATSALTPAVASSRQIPMPLIQQQPVNTLPKPMHGVSIVPNDNNMWAVKWLQTVCEVCPESSIEQNTLYKQYTASAIVQQWKGVITQGEFANCVKSVFSTAVTAVGRRPSSATSGPTAAIEYYFDGIRSRLQIVTTTVLPQQAAGNKSGSSSSILKAQLSAPPRAVTLSVTDHSDQAVCGVKSKQLSVNGIDHALEQSRGKASVGSANCTASSAGVVNGYVLPNTVTNSTHARHGDVTSLVASDGRLHTPNGIDQAGLPNSTASRFSAPPTPQKTNQNNGVSTTKNGTDLLASALDLAGLTDDFDGLGEEESCEIISSPDNGKQSEFPSHGHCDQSESFMLRQSVEKTANEPQKQLHSATEQQPTQKQTGLLYSTAHPNAGISQQSNVLFSTRLVQLPKQEIIRPSESSLSDHKTQAVGQSVVSGVVVTSASSVDDTRQLVIQSTGSSVDQSQRQPSTHSDTHRLMQVYGVHSQKRPAEVSAGGDIKRLALPQHMPKVVGSATATGSQMQHVMVVPQSVANMVLKLPVSLSSGQQLVLPQGGQLLMTSSGQLVLSQQPNPVLATDSIPSRLLVGQSSSTQPQALLLPQQQSMATRALILVSQQAVRMPRSPAAQPTRPAPPPAQSTTTIQPAESVQKAASGDRPLPAGLLCEWQDCLRGFPTAHAVYQHAIETHCPPSQSEFACRWLRCDGMVRKRYSMMTHLQDRHCTDAILRMMRTRREQMVASGKVDVVTASQPTPHPGYANNAAMQAIRRHGLAEASAALASSSKEDGEGPVTKSIRLTAALVLRNMVLYSHHARRLLKRYEYRLLSVAASSEESSRTAAQILAELSHQLDDENS